MTGDYHGEHEHTHAQRVPFLVWALLAGLLILAGSVAALSGYVIGRVTVADQRNQRTTLNALHDREATCSVLLSIPVRERSAAMRMALRIDGCNNLHLPSVTRPHHQSASPSAQPSAPSSSEADGSPAPVVSHRTSHPAPQPTVTRTRTAEPPPPHRPSPTPTPSRTSCLNLPKLLPTVCK